jgi:hypothetical protein
MPTEEHPTSSRQNEASACSFQLTRRNSAEFDRGSAATAAFAGRDYSPASA